MTKQEKLISLFEKVEEEKKEFALDTIDEYLFFLDRIKQLEKLPYIRIDRRNPERQQLTPAARLIREYSQVLDSKRKTLLSILKKDETDTSEELLNALKQFE